MKLSRQTKEIIQTVIFLVVIAILIMAYVVYPLNRTKHMLARKDIDTFSSDSLVFNDPTIFTDSGLVVDTFRVEADGLTNLAGIYIPIDSQKTLLGTAILLPQEDTNRTSLIPLIKQMHNLGYIVVTYDQRATGESTGKYHGEGYYEANDLMAVISYLELREEIKHPLFIVGYRLGGDGAILASDEEHRINGIVAINPYLTTKRMQDILKKRYKTIWFPFYRTIMWWWYNMRSGYAAPYRNIDDIKPITCRTLLILDKTFENNSEVKRFKKISPENLLTILPKPNSESELDSLIIAFLNRGQKTGNNSQPKTLNKAQ